jgi:YjbE family integral membrane protein
MNYLQPEFWFALLQIIGINIVLSGDNAVVIALAARSLPPTQQKQAIRWGSGAAVVMRIALTVVAVQLLAMPWLKLAGSVLLLWIALQLLLPEDGHGDHKGVNGGMVAAVRAILIADFVMSIDNVIAVAAAAKGSLLLLIVGLAVSIPLVVFASTLLLKLMNRWPIIITLGAALLGWVSGEMAVSDTVTAPWIHDHAQWLHLAVPAGCAVLVVIVGKWLAARKQAQLATAPLIDLAADDQQDHKP